VNVSPILFIPLREQFHLTFSQLGLLVLANFITQLLCDLSFSGSIDRHGFRPYALLAPVVALLGFLLFAAAPVLFPQNPYIGMLLGTVLFSGSGGILEVLLSPIVDTLPLDEAKKTAAMSFIHAAYSWGQVVVVLITTVLVFLWGATSWPFIMLLWCIPAVLTFLMFLVAPFGDRVAEDNRQKFSEIFKSRVFVLCFFSIMAAGATELIISQWASSFIEKGLGVSKTIGDILGVCMFAAAMGTGRVLYGTYGAGLDRKKVVRFCFLSLIFCYLAMGLLPGRYIVLAVIVLGGFAVSIAWPTMLVEASGKFPLGGARLFALLAAGGDSGSSLGPWLAGKVMDMASSSHWALRLGDCVNLTVEQVSLRAGMLVGVLFALLGYVVLTVLCRIDLKKKGER